ncbi:hypothetical protein [Anaerocolumna sedimenticola]|uniref:hypothetical protein n=1 Tax=Anaerocolumna sedimenticola TaxID=2696063 RepID=UPI001FE3B1E3|nr:hypothetical protein [Anaerocolumna sedimenticola]
MSDKNIMESFENSAKTMRGIIQLLAVSLPMRHPTILIPTQISITVSRWITTSSMDHHP